MLDGKHEQALECMSQALAPAQNHLGTRTILTIKLLAFWPWQGDVKPLLSGWSEVSAADSHAGHSS